MLRDIVISYDGYLGVWELASCLRPDPYRVFTSDPRPASFTYGNSVYGWVSMAGFSLNQLIVTNLPMCDTMTQTIHMPVKVAICLRR